MKLNKRFIITLISLIILLGAAVIATLIAKGYRLSAHTGTISGTGIISITSLPDQASVYLDDHLTTATNANINSLVPKNYRVKVVKEGYIPWEKEVAVKEGLVTEIKATLYRSIPTVYPLTFNGIGTVLISPNKQKLLYVVPGTAKKSGVWIWEMSNTPIAFARGAEQKQIISPVSGIDFEKAEYRWSPDSREVLAQIDKTYYLLAADKLNPVPQDVTPTVEATLKTWDEDERVKSAASLATVKDANLRKVASDAAVLKFSPDETKLLYSKNGKKDFKVVDLEEKKTFNLPSALDYQWLPDSLHLLMVELGSDGSLKASPSPSPASALAGEEGEVGGTISMKDKIEFAKVSIIEFDGYNKAEIFAGNISPKDVFIWQDGSRFAVVSSHPTATASNPNLYGINLK